MACEGIVIVSTVVALVLMGRRPAVLCRHDTATAAESVRTADRPLAS